MSDRCIFPFEEITESDAQNVGGKAANLAKLVQAKLPVPNGFAVGLVAFGNDGNLHEAATGRTQQALRSAFICTRRRCIR